jgi:hypothetical protein
MVGPYLQWDPIMGGKRPQTSAQVLARFYTSDRDYDETKAINAGSNFYSFNPYWAATYFITQSGSSQQGWVTC